MDSLFSESGVTFAAELQLIDMKRILSGVVLIAMVIALVSCGSSRRGGVGCPNNPMNYRYR